MSMSDLIADSLTRVRNAQTAGHEHVDVIINKVVGEILSILKKEGFIMNFVPFKEGNTNMAKVELKYYKDKPVIIGLNRVSKPGRRVYQGSNEIKPALNNIGINIFSTSKGVVTGKDARNLNVGGEYLCRVW